MARRQQDTEALPLAASFRSAMSEYRAEFSIGGTGRYLPSPRGIQAQGSGADYHYANETQFFRGIERARDFDRNNMVVGSGVNKLIANVVQDGFTLDPTTSDEGFNTELKALWYDWCDNEDSCDWEQERTFPAMESMVLRNAIVDGDLLCLPLEDGSLQFIEAHRLRHPASVSKRNVIHGVELDPKTGRRIRYHVTKPDIDAYRPKTLADVQTYNARGEDGEKQVLHVYFPTRFSQRRGVTAFAPIAYPVAYHDDLQFAKLVQAQVCSAYAILEQQIVGQQVPPPPRTGDEPQTGARFEEALADGTTRTTEGISPGMRVRARPGWELKGFSPAVPNPEFFMHASLILTIIAINLDLPVHVLLLDPTKTNFSGWRGAIEQARIRFRKIQRDLIKQFHTPVYRWKLRQWAAEDKAIARRMEQMPARDFFSHAWHPPTWSYIEPSKDITANAQEAATCQTSRRRQRARVGEDWQDIVPEIVEDNAMLILAAQKRATELNKLPEFSDERAKLTWRDIAALPMPDGVTMAMKPPEEPEPVAVVGGAA